MVRGIRDRFLASIVCVALCEGKRTRRMVDWLLLWSGLVRVADTHL